MAAAVSAANNAAIAAAVAEKQAQEQSAPAHLANSVLNLVSLREHARKELNKILDPAKGKRIALVLDSNLSGPLFLVTDRRSLKEQGVERILPLTGEGFSSDIKHIIFLTRPRPELAQLIANTIHAISEPRSQKSFSIYFVPRRTMLCERVLADSGVYGDVVTGEYHLDLIPFDEDVLSLQMPLSFRELTLDGDPTCLFYVARSLMKLQSMFGLIPLVQGKGDNAFHVFNLMRRMRLEMSKDHFANLMPEIHSLILIDRQVDLVTPLLTQLTYEGLIDELLGVKNGHVEIETELLGKQNNPPQQQQQQAAHPAQDKKPVALNSSDPLYKDIRDAPFRTLGGYLHRKAEEIKETYKEKDSAQTVSQMKDFMKKFKSAYVEHNALQLHLAVAGKLSETFKSTQFDRRIDTEQNLINLRHESEVAIEQAISQGQPLLKVLRLLCLLSLTYGIKPKKFDFYRREILHTYGFEMLFTLNNLEKVGLLRKQTGRQVYPAVKKALRLCKDDCDPKTIDPKMFVFDTYTPISARLVEIAAERQGWNSINEALSMLPGRAFEAQQEIPAAVKERSRIPQEEQAKKPLTLVFFLGGVTFAEISAIRNLSERENATREYIVASTQLINGDTALAELTERVENSLRRSSADLK